MLLVDIPWAMKTWALPFLTVLAPSERYHQSNGKHIRPSLIGHVKSAVKFIGGFLIGNALLLLMVLMQAGNYWLLLSIW